MGGARADRRRRDRARPGPQADGPHADEPRVGGQHVARFTLQQHRPPEAVDDVNGPGTRLVLSGTSDEGIEKTVAVTLYRRYPGFAVFRVSYRNLSAAPVSLRGWTNGDFLVLASGHRADGPPAAPGFWCYSGASYEDRRDWVRPVKHGFTQDNFLGMEASDYGGGTPIVDVWRPDGGLAVGHVESSPKLVSLPVQEQRGPRPRRRVLSRETPLSPPAPPSRLSTPSSRSTTVITSPPSTPIGRSWPIVD